MSTSAPTSFFARVVLHYTEGSKEYTQFRDLMAELGFLKSIHRPNEHGVTSHYSLPGGIYFFDASQAINHFRAFSHLAECYNAISGAVETVMSTVSPEEQAENTPPSIFVAMSTDLVKFSGLGIAPLAQRPQSKRMHPRDRMHPLNTPAFVGHSGNTLNFIASVVLHHLEEGDSRGKFYEAMASLGFRKTINGFDTKKQVRVTHKLPDGLYHFDAGLQPTKTLEQVYQEINAAVAAAIQDESTVVQHSNNPASVFIASATTTAWNSLEDAEI